MNISKKLIITTVFTLCIPFIAQAYDANELAVEVRSIPNIIQNLRQQNSRKAEVLANWLDRKLIDNIKNSNYQDHELLIKVSNIYNNPTLTRESIVTILTEMMQEEAKNARNNKISDIAETLGMTILGMGVIGLTIWAIIEDIKNPRPVVYIRQRPRVTVTVKKSQPMAPIYFSPSFPYVTTSYQVYP